MHPVSEALQVLSDLRKKLICVEEIFGGEYPFLDVHVKLSHCKKKAQISLLIGNGSAISPSLGSPHEKVSPGWVKKELFPLLDELAKESN